MHPLPPAFESVDALKEFLVKQTEEWFGGRRSVSGDFDSPEGIDRQIAKATQDYLLLFWFSTVPVTATEPRELTLLMNSMMIDRRTGKGLPRHYRLLTPQEEMDKPAKDDSLNRFMREGALPAETHA